MMLEVNTLKMKKKFFLADLFGWMNAHIERHLENELSLLYMRIAFHYRSSYLLTK
jgi:hypothetical protein